MRIININLISHTILGGWFLNLQSRIFLHFAGEFYCVLLLTDPWGFRFALYPLDREFFKEFGVELGKYLWRLHFRERNAEFGVYCVSLYLCVYLLEKIRDFITAREYLDSGHL